MTTVIVSDRQTGKTTTIVEALRQDPDGVLVVSHSHKRDRIAAEFNLRPSQIICPGESHLLLGRVTRPRFYVDDAELVLSAMLGGEVVWATLTDVLGGWRPLDLPDSLTPPEREKTA